MAELIIMFREVLEASLIIGILYTYLKKSGNDKALKMLWSGVGAAILLSIIVSIVFQIVADGFEGNSSKIFEGIVMIIASVVLTTMIIWMAQNKNISEELKSKAKESLTSGFKYGIFTLAFVAVFREGVEIILFLYAIAVKDGVAVLPSIIGSILGLAGGYAIFVQGIKIPLKKFFNVTSVFLIFVAAGMLTYGVHELESGGVIPYMGGSIKVENNEIIATRINGDISAPFKIDEEKKAKKWASRIWDINPSKNDDGTYPAFHDKGSIGGLVKGFFGYNGDPSLIEFITWIVSMIGLNFLYQKVGKRKGNRHTE
tara:strand:- start:3174 stop:4115 length:942 start_codon:yes stop_codon:yes gene_type:complete